MKGIDLVQKFFIWVFSNRFFNASPIDGFYFPFEQILKVEALRRQVISFFMNNGIYKCIDFLGRLVADSAICVAVLFNRYYLSNWYLLLLVVVVYLSSFLVYHRSSSSSVLLASVSYPDTKIFLFNFSLALRRFLRLSPTTVTTLLLLTLTRYLI